MARFLSC